MQKELIRLRDSNEGLEMTTDDIFDKVIPSKRCHEVGMRLGPMHHLKRGRIDMAGVENEMQETRACNEALKLQNQQLEARMAEMEATLKSLQGHIESMTPGWDSQVCHDC